MRKASLGIITERTDAGNATRNNMCKGFLGKDDLISNHEVDNEKKVVELFLHSHLHIIHIYTIR